VYASPDDNVLAQILYQVWDDRPQNDNKVAPNLKIQQPAIVKSVYTNVTSSKVSIYIQSTLTADLVKSYGGWQEAWTHIEFDLDEACLQFTVTLYDKSATHDPESAFLVFQTPSPFRFPLINKLNQWVDISNIIPGGSHHLHAADFPGVKVVDLYTVSSLDTAFVSVGYVTPFPFPNEFIDMNNARNISYGLVNNGWWTNYPTWYPYVPEDKDIQLRFKLQLH